MSIFATIGDCILMVYALGLLFAQIFPKTADAWARDARAGHLLTPGRRAS